jgi:hypothetical protein
LEGALLATPSAVGPVTEVVVLQKISPAFVSWAGLMRNPDSGKLMLLVNVVLMA